MTKQIKAPEQPDEYAGELKRRYLLRRFWKSAAGFWGTARGAVVVGSVGTLLLIILLNLATSYGMNVWTREIFDALQKTGFGHGSVSVDALLATAGGKRFLERHAGLCAHDDPTAMARVAQ